MIVRSISRLLSVVETVVGLGETQIHEGVAVERGEGRGFFRNGRKVLMDFLWTVFGGVGTVKTATETIKRRL